MTPPPRLLCADLARSERFYRDALAFEPEGTDTGGVVLRLEAGCLLLLPDLPGAVPPAYPRGAGLTLGFAVAEVEALYAGAAAHGVRIVEPLPDSPPPRGDWAFVVMDPDGYALRFVQHDGSPAVVPFDEARGTGRHDAASRSRGLVLPWRR